jgi:hypothetical protein
MLGLDSPQIDFVLKTGIKRWHTQSPGPYFFVRWRLRSRTPGPPPFSSMNSRPLLQA